MGISALNSDTPSFRQSHYIMLSQLNMKNDGWVSEWMKENDWLILEPLASQQYTIILNINIVSAVAVTITCLLIAI